MNNLINLDKFLLEKNHIQNRPNFCLPLILTTMFQMMFTVANLIFVTKFASF